MEARIIRRILRFVVYTALVAVVSSVAGAWLFYRANASADLAFLRAENERLKARQEQLEAMIDRLGDTRRVAHVVVTDQQRDPGGGVTQTSLRFVEIDDDDEPLAVQDFTIPGGVAFFDGLVIKFGVDDVAQGHPLRGQSIVLMRRVYSERQAPTDGMPIDTPLSIPAAYRPEGEAAEFERALWSQFWRLASDPDFADERGVRVAQGEAVYKPMRPGVLYELSVDAVGGLNLVARPLPDAIAEVLIDSIQRQ